MKLQVWKNQRPFTNLLTYSIRPFSEKTGKVDPIVILEQHQFENLFLEVDPDSIPFAPKTSTLEMEIELKEKNENQL